MPFSTHSSSFDFFCSGFFRHVHCHRSRVPSKRFVYMLQSQSEPGRFYTGVTSNLRGRLAAHNAGECRHTAKHGPWSLHVVVAFRDQSRAVAFERYLKSGSGCAFAKRHLR